MFGIGGLLGGITGGEGGIAPSNESGASTGDTQQSLGGFGGISYRSVNDTPANNTLLYVGLGVVTLVALVALKR